MTAGKLLSKWLAVAVLCLSSPWPVAAATGDKDEPCLYMADGKPLALEDFPAFLERQFRNNVPVVLYVHGRVKMPARTLAKKRIERQYAVACVMFSWDSSFGVIDFMDRERPLGMVPRGAEKLKEVLALVPPQADRGQGRLTLLVHSMGSIVLQNVVTSGAYPPHRLFDNILLTQPDCDAQGHVAWVTSLASLERVYLTQNGNDYALKQAGDARPAGVFSLGLGTAEPKAMNASYLDLTNLVGKSHRLFSLGAMDSQVCVAETIRGILRGESGHPTPACIAEQDGPTFRLKGQRDAKHRIFQDHPGDEVAEQD